MWVKFPDNKPNVSGWYEVTYESTFPVSPWMKGTELDLSGKLLKCVKYYDREKSEWRSSINENFGLLSFSEVYDPVVAYNPDKLPMNDEPWSPGSEEVFKDIPGWEGLYQISNYGRVKSLLRTVNRVPTVDECGNIKRGPSTMTFEERILKHIHIHNSICVRLQDRGFRKSYSIRYLLQQSFNSDEIPDKVKEYVRWPRGEK